MKKTNRFLLTMLLALTALLGSMGSVVANEADAGESSIAPVPHCFPCP